MKYFYAHIAKALVRAVIERPEDADAISGRFALLLQQEKAPVKTDALLALVGRYWDEQTRSRRVRIVTARSMPAVLKAAKKYFEGREVETNIDPSLIGGAWVQVGDRLLDGSVKAKLERLRTILQR